MDREWVSFPILALGHFDDPALPLREREHIGQAIGIDDPSVATSRPRKYAWQVGGDVIGAWASQQGFPRVGVVINDQQIVGR